MTAYNFALSAKLSPKVLEKMIARVVGDQTGRKVNRVEFNTRTEYQYEESYFDGVTVYFEGQ